MPPARTVDRLLSMMQVQAERALRLEHRGWPDPDHLRQRHGRWLLDQLSSDGGRASLLKKLDDWSDAGLFRRTSRARKRTRLDSPEGEERAWVLVDLHLRGIPIRDMRRAVEQPWSSKPRTQAGGRLESQTHPVFADSDTGMRVRRYVVMRPILHILNGDEPAPGSPGQIFEMFLDTSLFEAAVDEEAKRRGVDRVAAERVVEADRKFAHLQPISHILEPVSEEQFLAGVNTPELYQEERCRLVAFLEELKQEREPQSKSVRSDYRVDDGDVFIKADGVLSLVELSFSQLFRIRNQLVRRDNDWLIKCGFRECSRYLFPWEAQSAYCCDEHKMAENRRRSAPSRKPRRKV